MIIGRIDENNNLKNNVYNFISVINIYSESYINRNTEKIMLFNTTKSTYIQKGISIIFVSLKLYGHIEFISYLFHTIILINVIVILLCYKYKISTPLIKK